MVEWRRRPTGPGEIIDRRGPIPVRPLHPSGPQVEAENQQMGRRERIEAGQRVAASEGELGGLLTQIFDRLSRQMAGGVRSDPRDLLPGAADPLEGLVPEEMVPEVQVFDWFDPTVWAKASPEQMSMVDLSQIPAASGPGKDGKGLDWFRGGEAPNNYTNRHNPLYQARREFAVAVAPKIEEMFGVSAQGSAGYMRAPSRGDAAPGGRSANSDHYSGGAIDFFGSKEEMVNLRNWLVEHAPWVSFVRCQSESHFDHVHVSIDLGWIAQNYFQGRSIPATTAGEAARSPSTPSIPSSRTSQPSPGGRRPGVM